MIMNILNVFDKNVEDINETLSKEIKKKQIQDEEHNK